MAYGANFISKWLTQLNLLPDFSPDLQHPVSSYSHLDIYRHRNILVISKTRKCHQKSPVLLPSIAQSNQFCEPGFRLLLGSILGQILRVTYFLVTRSLLKVMIKNYSKIGGCRARLAFKAYTLFYFILSPFSSFHEKKSKTNRSHLQRDSRHITKIINLISCSKFYSLFKMKSPTLLCVIQSLGLLLQHSKVNTLWQSELLKWRQVFKA